MYEKELENLEKLRIKLESKTYVKPVYSSMISCTRNGCMNKYLRMNNESALPVRVTIKDNIKESICKDIIDDVIKKNKRHIYAEYYVKNKNATPVTGRWR